jgi:cytoskeletal protein RodZ
MADSEQKNSKQPPWHQANDLEAVSFGTWLRRQREARSIELREIADHTKIGIRYLEALEQDRFDVLPAPVFTKGFLRQYGR